MLLTCWAASESTLSDRTIPPARLGLPAGGGEADTGSGPCCRGLRGRFLSLVPLFKKESPRFLSKGIGIWSLLCQESAVGFFWSPPFPPCFFRSARSQKDCPLSALWTNYPKGLYIMYIALTSRASLVSLRLLSS